MKKYLIISGLKLIGIIGFIVLFVFTVNKIRKQDNFIKVEKGQKWVKTLQDINPYGYGVYDTVEVLDVTDDYALVKYHGDTVIWEQI